MITKEYLQQELRRRIEGIKPGVETTTDLTIGEIKSILVLVDALNDYEKKYNEALERAKAYYRNELAGTRQEMTEYIFPELRESEDKNIRKELIEFIKSLLCNDAFDRYKLCSWIAWLEKQKEQKPVDYEHEMWKNCKVNFEGGKKEVIEHPEKYGLQKPAEWSEEDERMLERTIHIIVEYSDIDEKESEIVQNWLKSLRPQPHWKPSEEQMEGLKFFLEFHRSQRNAGTVNWREYDAIESLYEQLKKL